MTPDLVSTYVDIMDARMAAVHTNMIARVVTYDVDTQRAHVRPLVRRPVPTLEPGVFRMETYPDVYGVKVMWPSGSGGYLHLELEPGDIVTLLFCELDPSRALRTGEVSDPSDLRRHSLAHAVAFPGGGTLPDVGLVVPKAAVGGDTDAAALASQLNLLITTLSGAGTGSETAIPAALLLAFPDIVNGVPGATTGSSALKVGS